MLDWVINSSIPKNLTPNKAASPYALENFKMENDNYESTAGYQSEFNITQAFLRFT